MYTLKSLQLFSIAVLLLGTWSCKIVANFPICESLSKGISDQNGVSKHIMQACIEHNIKVTVLSSTIAQFSGHKNDMKWLQKNYHILICDFDQEVVVEDRKVYVTCMTNSQKWIEIVQSTKPEDLMLPNTHYEDLCCHRH